MAITLNSTLSDPEANSYVSIAYADEYWSINYQASKAIAWAALTTNQKTSVLISATRILETIRFVNPRGRYEDYNYRWDRITGTVRQFYVDDETPGRYDRLQSLQFPRHIDIDEAGATFVPEPVKQAQCEQAVYLLTVDDTALTNMMQGIVQDAIKVGNISIRQKFAEGKQGSILAPMSLQFLEPFMLRSIRLRRA